MIMKTLIKSEIIKSHKRTLKLINEIAHSDWLKSPKEVQTNINWQIGHLIIANYLHGIASIIGPQEHIRERIDIKSYVKFYGLNSDPTTYYEYKPNPQTLIDQINLIHNTTLETIETLDFNKLDIPTAIKNPGAKTQLEALLWMVQHQSWHNGQLALLKRVLKLKP